MLFEQPKVSKYLTKKTLFINNDRLKERPYEKSIKKIK